MATKTLAERAAALAPFDLTPLLKQAELLDYYGISRWTADEWVKAGCPVERLPSGGRRFKLAAVDEWRRERAEDGTQVLAEKSRHALAARRAS